MNADKLVEMANRIGEFFAAFPDRAEAQAEIAQHLRKFWEPRMRQELLAHVDRSADSGLLPIVHQAVIARRHELI
jgi:formate dehydrogenase subunit delta